MSESRMDTMEKRFVRYCKVDTQSDQNSTTAPSTACQLDLSRMLIDELLELGIGDAELTEYGVVFGTLKGNVTDRTVPTIAFVAHVDTAPSFFAEGVKPLVHRDWDGSPIVLPDNPDVVIDPALQPYLQSKKGDTIVTASGTTLLGADDKAGIAIIMGLIDYLKAHPEIPRGDIRICFTPDEEIGRGVSDAMVKDLKAEFAYTLDGENPGDLVAETFSADRAVINIKGVSIHTCCAKDRLVNALYLASKIVTMLPKDHLSPESTEGREGFIFMEGIYGNAAEADMILNLRDFELDGLKAQAELLESICNTVNRTEPRARITCTVTPQYRNMRYWLKDDPRPVELAQRAYADEGMPPNMLPFRGGTDGSIMTEKGIPTPNIFCGMQAPHGPMEWVSIQDMDKALLICARVVRYWAEEA
ncbi:peptidase T [Pseudodesulfovibrio sp.]|uniref:peptidase T n=1 Tax=unclassified Pseudodesulfovibrio TaxID=2661612 RepID=UPI003B00A994